MSTRFLRSTRAARVFATSRWDLIEALRADVAEDDEELFAACAEAIAADNEFGFIPPCELRELWLVGGLVDRATAERHRIAYATLAWVAEHPEAEVWLNELIEADVKPITARMVKRLDGASDPVERFTRSMDQKPADYRYMAGLRLALWGLDAMAKTHEERHADGRRIVDYDTWWSSVAAVDERLAVLAALRQTDTFRRDVRGAA